MVALEQKELALETAQAELGTRLHATSSEFKEALTTEVGATKEEMARRAANLEKSRTSRKPLPPAWLRNRVSRASRSPPSAGK